jgi:hypothetical protein
MAWQLLSSELNIQWGDKTIHVTLNWYNFTCVSTLLPSNLLMSGCWGTIISYIPMCYLIALQDNRIFLDFTCRAFSSTAFQPHFWAQKTLTQKLWGYIRHKRQASQSLELAISEARLVVSSIILNHIGLL